MNQQLPKKIKTPINVTCDYLLSERVCLQQPTAGFRVSVDAPLLAAALPDNIAHIHDALEVGCASGAISLCWLKRLSAKEALVPHLRVVGIDMHQELIKLAHANATLNGLSDYFHPDVAHWPLNTQIRMHYFADSQCDLIFSNPPWNIGQRANLSKVHTEAANIQRHDALMTHEEQLQQWISQMARLLRPKGLFYLIIPPSLLPLFFRAIEERLGAIELFPIHPRRHTQAHRVIIKAQKAARKPMVMHPPLILHPALVSQQKDTPQEHTLPQYTDAANALLKHAKSLYDVI